MQGQFVRRPFVVQAFQMTAERRTVNVDWPEWLDEIWGYHPLERRPTLWYNKQIDLMQLAVDEGVVLVGDDAWIIKYPGGFVVMDDEDFRQAYDEMPEEVVKRVEIIDAPVRLSNRAAPWRNLFCWRIRAVEDEEGGYSHADIDALRG